MSTKGASGAGPKSPRGKRSASAANTARNGDNNRRTGPQTLQERNGTVKRKFWTKEGGYDAMIVL